MLYPLTFKPIYKERPWGGRRLEELYGRKLPPDQRIGESWEISDREGDFSEIAEGPFAGKTLRWLMEEHGSRLLGSVRASQGRFPLLIKILDAQETLSLQVHPPARIAAQLHGEPKTEMWYLVDATPSAELMVGLRAGVGRTEFERRLREGTVAECFHRNAVRPGDAMFVPSGRVHAIGAGCVLFEVQQNSDTTYRVFDWNRMVGGRPRALHIDESLSSIDFEDIEPPLVSQEWNHSGPKRRRALVEDRLFAVIEHQWPAGTSEPATEPGAQVIGVVSGRLEARIPGYRVLLRPGQFSVLPANLPELTIEAVSDSRFLRVRPG